MISVIKIVKFIFSVFVLPLFLVACNDNDSSSDIASITKKYENQIIQQQPANRSGIEDGLFLVKNGKKLWIANPSWIQKNRYDLNKVNVISSAEFNLIPLNPVTLE